MPTKVSLILFFALVFLIIGIAIGFNLSSYYYSNRFDEAIKLGGIIHKTVVYDVKLRP